MKYFEAINLIDNHIYPEKYDEKDKLILDEIIEMSKTYNLEPKAITTYNRQAFM
jgi:hypothetical protein